LPVSGINLELILPPNAIIVGARIQSPAGGTGSGFPPAYSIRTAETLLTYSAGTISAAAADNSINDSAAAFPAFAVGDRISVTGFTGAGTTANAVATVVSRTASKIVLSGVTLVNDAAGETVTVKGPGFILDLASIGSAASSGYDMAFSGFIPLGTTDARRTLVLSGATDQYNGTANAVVEYIA
jgi:hypothetical protein